MSDPQSFTSPVHIISGDLILYKRTLSPIKTLVYGMRRYDLDRVVALYDSSEQGAKRLEGYMSSKAKIYLADVHDHMEYILTSIEMFAGISENLINFSFNVSPVFHIRKITRPGSNRSRCLDVIARDERGNEDADYCHCLVRTFDPAHRLLRSSSPSSLSFQRSNRQRSHRV